ncbi:MAG: hypothetical protein M0R77_02920 [Gammaproteobacteria bacterium]|nr:hypothetical protein [Gammaproteobacteria bacterium]
MEKFIVLLNNTGDVCISWDKDQDLELLTYIQKKIDAGYIFFVTDRTFFNLVKRKKAIKSVNEIGKDRKVYLDDADAEQLAADNKITISKIETDQVNTISKAKTAQDVVSAGAAVAVRPAKGG